MMAKVDARSTGCTPRCPVMPIPNTTLGESARVLWIELAIPLDARPGTYSASIAISATLSE